MERYMEMYNKRSKFNGFIRSAGLKTRTHQFLYGQLQDGAVVLDFGCGNGSLGYLGKDTHPGRNVTIVGYDSDMANEKAEYHDLEEIGDRHFSHILLSHVLEHCDPPVVKAILGWCRAHGDRLIITLPNSGDNLFVNFFLDITHVRPYNNIDFLLLLEGEGFNVEAAYRSELEQNLSWYGTLSRLAFAFLTQTSPYIHYNIFCSRKDG